MAEEEGRPASRAPLHDRAGYPRPGLFSLTCRGHEHLAQMAGSPFTEGPPHMGALSRTACPTPASPAAGRAQHLHPDSKPLTRRAGCGHSARPDLWGPWGSNPPGLPELWALGPEGDGGAHDGQGALQPDRFQSRLVDFPAVANLDDEHYVRGLDRVDNTPILHTHPPCTLEAVP